MAIQFSKPAKFTKDMEIVHFDEPHEKPDYSSHMVTEVKKDPISGGDSAFINWAYPGSSLMSLPLEVRMRIWEAVFMAANRPIVVYNRLHMGLGDLAILRVCRAIHEEASIAMNSVMCRRKIVFENFTVKPLETIFENESWGSYKRFSKEWTKLPCPSPTAFPTLGQNGIFESVVFYLGSSNINRAVKRRQQFAAFVAALAATQPFKIRVLTIVAQANWRIDGLDEMEIMLSLFSGAFAFVHRINFLGFSDEERAVFAEKARVRSMMPIPI